MVLKWGKGAGRNDPASTLLDNYFYPQNDLCLLPFQPQVSLLRHLRCLLLFTWQIKSLAILESSEATLGCYMTFSKVQLGCVVHDVAIRLKVYFVEVLCF